MDILIIGGGLQALSVAHSLKKRGYVVIALLYKGDISTKSKYINKFYTTDITPKNKEGYLSAIYCILEQHLVSVIIPLSDTTAELLSLHKKELEQKYCLDNINSLKKKQTKKECMKNVYLKIKTT